MLLQTEAAYVHTERIDAWYGVILLGMDNVESHVRRGKSWQRMPVTLCVTEVKCLVNRSLGSTGYVHTCVLQKTVTKGIQTDC